MQVRPDGEFEDLEGLFMGSFEQFSDSLSISEEAGMNSDKLKCFDEAPDPSDSDPYKILLLCSDPISFQFRFNFSDIFGSNLFLRRKF